jgi:alanine dehydrogenase
MVVGTVKEIKNHEYRVGMTPEGARLLAKGGHTVLVEKGAGENAGFEDDMFRKAGARIVGSQAEVFESAQMIVKVKEPLKEECAQLRKDQIVFTYLHLASSKELAEDLLEKKVIGIAYETIATADAQLPCLKPMSEIAGRLSIQAGATFLQRSKGGMGVLLSGVAGVRPANVAIIGAGVVGSNACRIAKGMGASVMMLDNDQRKLDRLDEFYRDGITTLFATEENLEEALRRADLVICAVLVKGGKTPVIITRKHLGLMNKGSVIVDVSIDQGGCAETSRPTSHDDPVYTVDGVVHYCVVNMPGAVPFTSTRALTNATLKYMTAIADLGVKGAQDRYCELAGGVNLYKGSCVYKTIADDLGLKYTPLNDVLR